MLQAPRRHHLLIKVLGAHTLLVAALLTNSLRFTDMPVCIQCVAIDSIGHPSVLRGVDCIEHDALPEHHPIMIGDIDLAAAELAGDG